MKYIFIFLLMPSIIFAQEKNTPYYLYKTINKDKHATGTITKPGSIASERVDITIEDRQEIRISDKKYMDPNECAKAAIKACNFNWQEFVQAMCSPARSKGVNIKGVNTSSIGSEKTAKLIAEYKQNTQEFCNRSYRFSYDENSSQFYDNGVRSSKEDYLKFEDSLKCSDAELKYRRQGISGIPPECSQPKEQAEMNVRAAIQSCLNNASGILSSFNKVKDSERNSSQICMRNYKLDYRNLGADESEFSVEDCTCRRMP